MEQFASSSYRPVLVLLCPGNPECRKWASVDISRTIVHQLAAKHRPDDSAFLAILLQKRQIALLGRHQLCRYQYLSWSVCIKLKTCSLTGANITATVGKYFKLF